MLQRITALVKDIADLSARMGRTEARGERWRDELRQEIITLRRQVARLADGHRLAGTEVHAGTLYGQVPADDVARFIRETPGLSILDVRPEARWLDGHLPGSNNVPGDTLAGRLHTVEDPGAPMLILCADGGASVRAAKLLSEADFTGIYVAQGGMAAWTGPVQRGQAPSPLISIEERRPRGRAHPAGAGPEATGGTLVILEVAPTPNPEAMKFVLRQRLAGSPRPYASADAVEADPLARALFEVSGTASVYIAPGFININKRADAHWSALIPAVTSVIEATPVSEALKGTVNAGAPAEADDPDLLGRIERVLDAEVRPALAADGGGIKVVGLEGTTLFVRYQGACGGCPSATQGTMMAITDVLRRSVDEQISVVARG